MFARYAGLRLWRGARMAPRLLSVGVREPLELLRSKEPQSVRRALCDLAEMTKTKALGVSLVDAGGVDDLAELCRSVEPGHSALAAHVISQMTSEETYKAISQVALPGLVHVLKTGSMDGKHFAAAALSTIARDGARQIAAGRAGAVQPLVDVLRDGDAGARQNSAAALMNLACDADNAANMVACGAMPLLIQLCLSPPNPKALEFATLALANIRLHPHFRLQVEEAMTAAAAEHADAAKQAAQQTAR
ncbi:armadillo-type protein [Pelagophyceae sp. CCMP2097]|nr:armadillo-type protein [Pelagophyceae sp. CCMP2097]|mmetsp:Transcript_10468/g.37084  ORF Transcript_10468/g.37084 Transcript_10468/m.37084 type:complete len:248 (+) Transcript_10468:101-844(+)